MMPWLWVAIGLNGVAVLVLLGALWVTVRGMGGISALASKVMILETALEQCSERITREVKARAGLAGAEKTKEERTIAEQAVAELEKPFTPTAVEARPKRQYRRR